MTPYKMHSLVKRKGENTILVIIDRRLYRYNNGRLFIEYTLIEPHDAKYHSYANHDGLVPLVLS